MERPGAEGGGHGALVGTGGFSSSTEDSSSGAVSVSGVGTTAAPGQEGVREAQKDFSKAGLCL